MKSEPGETGEEVPSSPIPHAPAPVPPVLFSLFPPAAIWKPETGLVIRLRKSWYVSENNRNRERKFQRSFETFWQPYWLSHFSQLRIPFTWKRAKQSPSTCGDCVRPQTSGMSGACRSPSQSPCIIPGEGRIWLVYDAVHPSRKCESWKHRRAVSQSRIHKWRISANWVCLVLAICFWSFLFCSSFLSLSCLCVFCYLAFIQQNKSHWT